MAYRFSSFFVFGLLLSPILAYASFPTAAITTNSAHVVLVGSTVLLEGGSSQEGNSFYRWRFAKKPFSSQAFFSTPSPSMPSFVVDQEGLYLIELIVGNDDEASGPTYHLISAAMPAGTAVFSNSNVSTPALCALSLEVLGCSEVATSFQAVAGDYSMNVTNSSAKSLSVSINSNLILSREGLAPGAKLSIPVTLVAENQLQVDVRGGVGSSMGIEIVPRVLPTDSNTPPGVADLTLSTSDRRRRIIRSLAVTDPDLDQNHSFELLTDPMNGIVSLMGSRFEYTSFEGFKGREKFYLLSYDDGSPQKGVISTVTVSIDYNTAPRAAYRKKIHVPVDIENFSFILIDGTDLEGDVLTYSIIDPVSEGSLSCLNERGSFVCQYSPPSNFRGSTSFSYRVNDGLVNSGRGVVTLQAHYPDSAVSKLVLGGWYSCALFDQNNIRCWGHGGGSTSAATIGFHQAPISLGDLDFSKGVMGYSRGERFGCFLLDPGEVKCVGNNQFNQIAGGGTIDFGTTLKVIAITSGDNHSCALFESGQVKCWGENSLGHLGLGHTLSIGADIRDADFVKLRDRAVSLSLGRWRSCALLEGGDVTCWGRNLYGALGLGHTMNIGDDEHPSTIPAVSLGGRATQVSAGNFFSCALLESGQVRCWGYGYSLGAGNAVNIGDDELPSSVEVVNLGEPATYVASGSNFSCAILESGSVRCWGANSSGQLGLGHTDHVGDDEHPSSEDPLALSEDVIQISAGKAHACVVLASGKVHCWGKNRQSDRYGAGLLGLGHGNDIGDDETLEYSVPVKVGGDGFAFYPRFRWPLDIKVNRSAEFDASHSYAEEGIASYAWDFGDDDTASGMKASHTFTTAGEHTVTLTLTDTAGATSSMEKVVKVRATNGPPYMGNNLSFEVTEGETLSFEVDAALDWEGDPLTYQVVDAVSSGTLSECLDGDNDLTCEFDPPSDFTGIVTFSYRANDGNSLSPNVAHVTIEVVEGSDR